MELGPTDLGCFWFFADFWSTWAGGLPCLSLRFLTCKAAEGTPPRLRCGQEQRR